MIDFPANPSLGQQATSELRRWVWDGVGWRLLGSLTPTDPGQEVQTVVALPFNAALTLLTHI